MYYSYNHARHSAPQTNKENKMKVRAWNTYKIDGTGELVIGREINAATVTQALDAAEIEARAWNTRHKNSSNWPMRVNMLSCNGSVRAIL